MCVLLRNIQTIVNTLYLRFLWALNFQKVLSLIAAKHRKKYFQISILFLQSLKLNRALPNNLKLTVGFGPTLLKSQSLSQTYHTDLMQKKRATKNLLRLFHNYPKVFSGASFPPPPPRLRTAPLSLRIPSITPAIKR